MKILKTMVLILVIAFAAIQLVPVKRDNPSGKDTFTAPANVKEIIVRSCYDCHSNETRWLWYTYVAPISWIGADHVHEAREEMNLSNWAKLPPEKQKRKMWSMLEHIEEGEMPLSHYLTFHPEARISKKDLQILREWVSKEGGVIPEEDKENTDHNHMDHNHMDHHEEE